MSLTLSSHSQLRNHAFTAAVDVYNNIVISLSEDHQILIVNVFCIKSLVLCLQLLARIKINNCFCIIILFALFLLLLILILFG